QVMEMLGCKDGCFEGECMEYSEEGMVVIRGQYAKDMKEGIWRRHSVDGKEIGQSTFKAGKLIEGDDYFPEFTNGDGSME
ncbi:MAG TPA: hypothetical protein VMW24_01160, partial [Sedimentisphaerales bacterium]|nr:hypothetical protein [Sedimentisphaerales bacterium]